jgi:hypothetical protein
MTVNKQLHVILGGFCDNGFNVIQIRIVVDAGTRMFDGFPRHKEAQKVQPPGLQSLEVFVGFIQRKRSADEAHIPMLKKAFAQVGCAIGLYGNFAAAGYVDPAQNAGASVCVFEVCAVSVYYGNEAYVLFIA